MIKQIEKADTKEGLSFQRIISRSLWSFKCGRRKEGYDARIMRIDAKFIYIPLCPML